MIASVLALALHMQAAFDVADVADVGKLADVADVGDVADVADVGKLAVNAPIDGAHRFAVVVGESDGGGDRMRLRYASADARAMHLALVELGGIAAEDAALVVEPGLRGLSSSLREVAQRLAAARARGERTELVFYYSGHSDEGGLLLGGERFTYGDLRRSVDAMAADLRVVVLDSCASGELTRTKGVVRRPAFLSDVGQVRGHAFLTSSAADESAQESDAIGASFFTHSLVTGLRGAADTTGDGRVSLTEAYEFAFHETLARTERTTLGGQHPAYAMNLAGTGDVVLTDLTRAEATLVLDEPSAGRFSVRDHEARLIAELRKHAGRTTELALPAGTYSILVERDRERFSTTVELAAGARIVFDETKLEPVDGEPVTARGPTPEELARRDAERAQIARRVYEREKLRVEPPRDIFDEGPFKAYAGDVAVPLMIADFFDRAERPDLVQKYDDNILLSGWLTWGGLGGEIAFGTATVMALLIAAVVVPVPTAAMASALGVGATTGLAAVVASGIVGMVGTAMDPVPVSLEEASEIARVHNERLATRLGLAPTTGAQLGETQTHATTPLLVATGGGP